MCQVNQMRSGRLYDSGHHIMLGWQRGTARSGYGEPRKQLRLKESPTDHIILVLGSPTKRERIGRRHRGNGPSNCSLAVLCRTAASGKPFRSIELPVLAGQRPSTLTRPPTVAL